MEKALLSDIENAFQLKCAIDKFDDFVSHNKSFNKCNLALKLLIEVYRLHKNARWKTDVDANYLSLYVIHLCKCIQNLNCADIQKFLTVICHIHRFIISKKAPADICDQVSHYVLANPNLMLVAEHSKTYWIILVDKISYLQNSKVQLSNEHSLYLMENVLKYFEVVDIFNFCKETLPWVTKNFFVLFNENSSQELVQLFEKLFSCLYKSQISSKKIIPKDISIDELFKSSLICLVYVHQNIAVCERKSNRSCLAAIKFFMSIFKNHPGCLHHFQCLQMLVPTITTELENLSLRSHNVIDEVIEKMKLSDQDYKNELRLFSLPFRKILSLCLSQWAETTDELWKKNMFTETQNSMLRLIILIMSTLSKLKEQSVKCNNCIFQNGIHDTFQLAGFARSFIVNSAKHKMNLSQTAVLASEIYKTQVENVGILRSNGCANWSSYWSKIESDHHKDAILLYSLGLCDFSIKYFEVHTLHYIESFCWENNICELDHLSRVFYNMAICQMDLQKYTEALKSCYISMAIAAVKELPVDNEKYARFAFQIKAKVFSLTSSAIDDSSSLQSNHLKTMDQPMQNTECNGQLRKIEIQNVTIWSAVKEFLSLKENNFFYDIFSDINFGELLLIELNLYGKSWPSTVAMAGVCESLQDFIEHENNPDAASWINTDCNTLAIIAGKAVTTLSAHSHKLNNQHLCGFIKSTVRLLERTLEGFYDSAVNNNEPIFKILLANCYQASYQCDILEKRKLGSELIANADVRNIPYEHHRSTAHPDDVCDVAPTHQFLSLSVEDTLMEPLLKALQLWKEAIIKKEVHTKDYFNKKGFNSDIKKTLEIIDVTTQTLALHGLDFHSLIAADVMYAYATLLKNRIGILNSAGFLFEHSLCEHSSLAPLISKCNGIVQDFLTREDKVEDAMMMNAIFEYLLNLAVYYFECDVKDKGIIVLSSVSNLIMDTYFSNKQLQKKNLDAINFSFAKLNVVKALCDESKNIFESPDECPSMLASYINAHVECSELIKIAPRGRCFPIGVRVWICSGIRAASVSLDLGLPRRARALLKSLLSTAQRLLLPRRAASVLALLASVDLACEQLDDCKVKIDGIRYIIDEQQNISNDDQLVSGVIKMQSGAFEEIKLISTNVGKDLSKEFEMVLDIPSEERFSASAGSPIFQPHPFCLPNFLNHKRSCECCKCTGAIIFNIFMDIVRIEALLHFMLGNKNIARTFYDGGMKVAKFIQSRHKYLYENSSGSFLNKCCSSILKKLSNKKIINAECQFLIDSTVLLISENNITKAKTYNSKVLDMIQEFSIDNRFTKQFASEQRMFLLQFEAFQMKNKNLLELDTLGDLQKDFSSKLMLTPEKSSVSEQFVFKTPHDNRTKINITKQSNSNTDNITGASIKKEKSEFLRPSVKLKLNYDDESDNPVPSVNIDSNFGALKTPLPKLRSRRLVLLEDSAKKTNVRQSATSSLELESQKDSQNCKVRQTTPRIKKDNQESKNLGSKGNNIFETPSSVSESKLKVHQNKSRLIRSASPGKLEHDSLKVATEPKVKRIVKPKIILESRSNLSPDMDLVKKYSIRKRK